jgi:hypothetical protein
MPLHERNRRPPRAQHDFHRLVVERILLARRRAVAARAAAVLGLRRLEHVAQVFRRRERLQMLDDLVDLVVGDERAVHPLRQAGTGRQVEHVAGAEQRLRAALV